MVPSLEIRKQLTPFNYFENLFVHFSKRKITCQHKFYPSTITKRRAMLMYTFGQEANFRTKHRSTQRVQMNTRFVYLTSPWPDMGFLKHSREKKNYSISPDFPIILCQSSVNEDSYIKPSGCKLHHTAASLIQELEMNAVK